MRFSLLFLSLFLPLSTALSLNSPLHRLVNCPCNLSIARPHRANAEKDVFDVLVFRHGSSSTSSPSAKYLVKSLSRRRVSAAMASRSDHYFHYVHHRISQQGRFRVVIVERPEKPDVDKRSSPFKASYRLLYEEMQCPIILSPHRPRPLSRQVDVSSTMRAEQPQNNIIGGNRAASSLVPYMVMVYTSDFYMCSGVLIHHRWFLSAAHCNIDTDAAVFIMTSQYGKGGKQVHVSRVVRHHRFGPALSEKQFDIQAVELTEDVRKYGAKRMFLGLSKLTPNEGTFLRVLGYGHISADGNTPDKFPYSLRQVDLPVVNYRQCKTNYEDLSVPTLVNDKYQFCVGYMRSGGCDACHGDSGGPLLQYDGYQPVLRGLVSRGAGCAEAGYPGINVRLSAFRDWLLAEDIPFTRHNGPLDGVRTKCKPGFYLKANGVKLATCEQCPPNEVSPGGPIRTCDPCPGGSARDPVWGDTCTCRALLGWGKVSDEEGVMCTPCKKGSYSRFRDHKCTKCKKGSFASEEGMEACEKCAGAPEGATECAEPRTTKRGNKRSPKNKNGKKEKKK